MAPKRSAQHQITDYWDMERRGIFDVDSLQYISSEEGDCILETGTAPVSASQNAGERAPAAPLQLGTALRLEVLQQLDRQPSATLDDGQLAVYLHFRGVPLSGVVDWGTFFYFEQHEYEYAAQRQEVAEQLQTTLADMDYFGVLAFFRHMLEGALLESFYTEVYRLVLARLRSAERVSFFADVIRPLPTDMAEADDDAVTPTELDEDSSAEQGDEADTP